MDVDLDRGSFGPLLRRLRLDAGISQEELAERARLSVESIGALERGRRRAPYRETIRMIADALQLSGDARTELEAAAKRKRSATGNVVSYESAASPATDSSDRRPMEKPRHNLIRPLSTFLNRHRELDELALLVREHRLVSIVGAGGIGKTRVAIELAWAILERYRDGVWFVDLAPLSDHMVVARSLIAILAIPEADGRGELDTLVHHLSRRDALIIIDNCEHVVEQVAILTDALLPWCPNLRILSTSREPLHVPGERVIRIPPLESPSAARNLSALETLEFAAVALFVDRSIAANSAFTYSDPVAGTVAEISRRLDGIALAIELAASRTAVLSPQQILVQLDAHFGILSGGSRTALPRQRTMYETIRWSYDRLTGAEQLLFRRVAIFVNGFTLDSVCALSTMDQERAFSVADAAMPQRGALDDVECLDVLTSLVDKSLIVTDASASVTRYRLQEPMRAFGLEMLTQAGERDRMRLVCAKWCLAFVRGAHETWAILATPAWAAQVEPEMDNIRACLLWALEDRNDVGLGQRIVAAARRIWGRLFPSEGKRWVRTAQQLVDARTAEDVGAGLALAEAHIHIVLHQYSTALNAAEACGTVHRGRLDELDLAEARGFAGFALAQLGRNDEGEQLMAASVEVYRARGAKALIAYGVNDLGIAHFVRGDLLAARSLFGEALTRFREVGNDRGAGSAAGNLAETEFCAGNVEAAVRLCQEALATFSRGRETRIYLANMAAYLVALGKYDEARERARDSILFGGMARADVDVALALQHLAAVAVLQTPSERQRNLDGVERAARLVGFVDSRLADSESIREFTEQREYDIIVERLQSELGSGRFAELRAYGRLWTEDDAVREALRI